MITIGICFDSAILCSIHKNDLNLYLQNKGDSRIPKASS